VTFWNEGFKSDDVELNNMELNSLF